MADSYEKIFVAHVTGLGKTVLAIPALRALRHYFPTSHITVATSYSTQEIIQLSHTADEILPVLRGQQIINPRASYKSIRTLNQLRKDQFDLTLELRRNAGSSFARFLAQSGASKQKRKFLTQIREAILRRSFANKHEAQIYLEIMSEIGAFPIDQEPKIYTDRRTDEMIETRLGKSGLRGLLIGLHPGSGRHKPRWSLENFSALANKLIHVNDARILVFAGAQERGIAKLIVKQLPAKKAVAFESLSLTEMASALARLSVFVTNHSGPAHFAAAMGTPVLSLATNAMPASLELLSPHHLTLRKDSLEEISLAEVFEAATQLLTTSRAESLWMR